MSLQDSKFKIKIDENGLPEGHPSEILYTAEIGINNHGVFFGSEFLTHKQLQSTGFPLKVLGNCKIVAIVSNVNLPNDLHPMAAKIDWSLASSSDTQFTPPPPPPEPRFHSHYFKDVRNLNEIDVYRVLKLFDVTDPCIQHAVKKLLVAGGRGAKNFVRDIREARDSLGRCLDMHNEDLPNEG